MSDLSLPRRGALAALGAAAALAWLKPRDHGAGGHDAYFQGLSKALRQAGIGHPVMVIDHARLAANIATVKAAIDPALHATRVVAKSVPSFALLTAIMDGVGTHRAMVFNGATLGQVAQARPEADLLLGKPLPDLEVADFVKRHAADTSPATRPQFLADSSDRLAGLIAIARGTGSKMRVNFELDVGLHRGGFSSPAALNDAITLALSEPLIELSGLMGYDPHVVKMPWQDAALQDALSHYAAAREVLLGRLHTDPVRLTLNTAGSPTYQLHLAERVSNELALGSAFVKPLDFDLPSLASHVPAAFIATPVIKRAGATQIPGLEALGPLLRAWDPNTAQTVFIYGGHWLARPVSPPGLQTNDLFGLSSNQEMLNGSARVALAADDYVFFRPTQSEAVLLQFGDLAVYRDGKIAEAWPTFPVSA